MAWVERDQRGGWVVRWRAGDSASPKLTAGPFTTRGQAEGVAAGIDGKVAAAKPLSRSRAGGAPIDLPETVHRWASARVADGSATPLYTRDVTALVLRLSRERGWLHASEITPAEIDRWRIERAGRVARACSYLGSVLRWAADHLGQDVSPSTLVALRPPRQKKRAKPPLPDRKLLEQWQRAADLCGVNCSALVHCLTTYPWRPIMAAKLLVGDVDLDAARITHRGLKGGGDDLQHPLMRATVERLTPMCVGRLLTDPVFLNPYTGAAWSWEEGERTPISGWWKRHIDKRNGHGVYQLKRYGISTMLSLGIAPQDIALFSGHRTLSQVLKYARTNIDQAAIALEKMASIPGAPVGQVTKSGGNKRNMKRA